MTTTIRGAVIADRTILDNMPPAAFRVVSWDNTHSPRTQASVETWCRANGFVTERSYRSKARGYWLFVYHDSDYGRRVGRLNCFASTVGAK